jgi:hypothetical protein
MSNRKKLPAGGRHVPRHRKQPSRTVGDLAAVPVSWSGKIAAAGLAGAALAIPATAALAAPASAATTPASPVTTIPAATATGIPGIMQADVSNAVKTLFQEQSPASAVPAPATGGDAILAQNQPAAPPAASGSLTVTFPDGTDHTFPLGTRVNPTDPTTFGPDDEIEVPVGSSFTDPLGNFFSIGSPGPFPLGPGLPTLRFVPEFPASDNSTGTTAVAANSGVGDFPFALFQGANLTVSGTKITGQDDPAVETLLLPNDIVLPLSAGVSFTVPPGTVFTTQDNTPTTLQAGDSIVTPSGISIQAVAGQQGVVTTPSTPIFSPANKTDSSDQSVPILTAGESPAGSVAPDAAQQPAGQPSPAPANVGGPAQLVLNNTSAVLNDGSPIGSGGPAGSTPVAGNQATPVAGNGAGPAADATVASSSAGLTDLAGDPITVIPKSVIDGANGNLLQEQSQTGNAQPVVTTAQPPAAQQLAAQAPAATGPGQTNTTVQQPASTAQQPAVSTSATTSAGQQPALTAGDPTATSADTNQQQAAQEQAAQQPAAQQPPSQPSAPTDDQTSAGPDPATQAVVTSVNLVNQPTQLTG